MDNLSYLHNIGSEPLKYLTLGQLADNTALKYGNLIAVDSVQQNRTLTYLEALNAADKFAAGLGALGMLKGDRLGLWAPNCIEWYVVNLACLRVGLLLVALNPNIGTSEMEYYINKVGIKVIVCPFQGKYNKFYDILVEVAPELLNTRKWNLSSPKVPSLKGIILISEMQPGGTYSYQEVMAMANETEIKAVKIFQDKISPDDACYIHFSSGTTGNAKAIVLNHFQVINNSYFIAKRCQLDQHHHLMCVQVPLFHVFGTIITITAAAHFGTTLVLPSMYYNPLKNFMAILDKKCSFLLGTPTMFIDLINIQKDTHERISAKIALMGGAPSTPELCRKMITMLNINDVKRSYGLTEATAAVFISLSGDEDYESVGYIGDHLQVKVVDGDGTIVPFGKPGEICVRGYTTMLGYWDDEAKSREALQIDGWLRTGDLGILQQNGCAKLVGRTTDMIVRGGENIYPKEIEDFLSTHPDISDVQVVGVPHWRLGEEVCACIRLYDGIRLTKPQLYDFCYGKIAHSKIPTQLRIVNDFPKTFSGKVNKNLLRERISKIMPIENNAY